MDNAPIDNAPQDEVVARRSHARKYTFLAKDSLSNRIANYDDFTEAVNKYATAIRKNILIHCLNNHGHWTDDEQEEGRIVINISATALPDSKRRRCEQRIITKVLGIDLDRRVGIFEPSDDKKYFNMYEEDGSTVIAQFSEDSIYILFNLLRIDINDVRLDLFRKILDKYLEYIKAIRRNKLEKFVEENEARRMNNFRQNFSKFYLGEMGFALENAMAEYAKSEKEIIYTRNTLTSQIKNHKFIQAKVAGFRQALANLDSAVISKQFDQLCLLSVNQHIFVEEGIIIVPVGQIDIEHEGVIYDIGDFDVKINTSQSGEYITCTNKTRVVNGDYHPHVTSSGSVCLGSIEEIIPQLINDMEYAAVVRIMIDFLHAYNPGDPFEYVKSWPVKGSKEVQEAQDESDNQS